MARTSNDPALEKALEERFPNAPPNLFARAAQQVFSDGWEAHARSLGAGTPEAQAALRELVVAARKWFRGWQNTPGSGWPWTAKHDVEMRDAMVAFAKLATPTEEGQG